VAFEPPMIGVSVPPISSYSSAPVETSSGRALQPRVSSIDARSSFFESSMSAALRNAHAAPRCIDRGRSGGCERVRADGLRETDRAICSSRPGARSGVSRTYNPGSGACAFVLVGCA
jgi:hypothetical protein